jgi:hypothetical protein
MELYRFNKETKEVELSPEARITEPFKTLARRVKKGYPGDADGRKKEFNDAEILFVYYSANYNSNLKHASDEEKLKLLKSQLKMPEDWLPDDVVKEAIEFFKKGQRTVSTPIYESAVNMGQALKSYYDFHSLRIKTSPGDYTAKEVLDIQNGISRLKDTLEEIHQAGQKVASEIEQKRNNKGRLMSRFETQDV